MRVARFTYSQQLLDQHQQSMMISIVHLPSSNQPSHFLPQLASSTSSSASLSSFNLQPQYLLPFSTSTHPVTKICQFHYCFHFITSNLFLLHCLSNILFTFPANKTSQKLWSDHFQSSTSTVDPLTTLYTQN